MFLNARLAPWSEDKARTKKALKEVLTSPGADPRSVEFYVETYGRSGYIYADELSPGDTLTVTNHPARTWFASVTFDPTTRRVRVS
jgi:hypothetical protein